MNRITTKRSGKVTSNNYVGSPKERTLVIDVISNKEYEFESRMDASKFTGVQRKHLNTYMSRNLIYKKQYRFIDISKDINK